MGSQWTNNYAILRDLSVAQGRKVPATIVGSVGVGQKPPNITIKEETKEDFFQDTAADGEVPTKPDLDLIKQMLNLVRDIDVLDTDDNGTEKIVEKSKLNPLSAEFLPSSIRTEVTNLKDDVGTIQCTKNIESAKTEHECINQEMEPRKKRKERNAALASLLEIELNSHIQTSQTAELKDKRITTSDTESRKMDSCEVKLMKPTDFTIDTDIEVVVDKAENLLHKPTPQPTPQPTNPLRSINLSPSSMFRKKKPAVPVLDSSCIVFKRKSDASSAKSSDIDIVPKPSDNVFVPTTQANEYYKQFVERRREQEKMQEDIWKRAERLMKEIENKRLKEKEEEIAASLGILESGDMPVAVQYGDH